ncbi:MAG: ABC transporter permease [Candidatus Omnitrophica bacterium]|nr:ABC transporter permease [Candidatus Omnitrophota bacterium]
MLKRIKNIYYFRHILFDMAINQLKAKYAGSRFGIWWAVIVPLLLALSINFVFQVISKIAIPNYAFFVLSGIMPWLFFTGALTEVNNSFIASASILKQSRCPHEFIPLSLILANLLNFLIGFIFILPLFMVIKPAILLVVAYLFLIILLETFFIIGLGLIFATLNVFFRDLSHFLSIGFTVWFWITPIFYSLDMIDLSYRWVCFLNPMSYFVSSYQSILFEAKAPLPAALWAMFVIAAVSCLAGYLIFIKNEPELLKRI